MDDYAIDDVIIVAKNNFCPLEIFHWLRLCYRVYRKMDRCGVCNTEAVLSNQAI